MGNSTRNNSIGLYGCHLKFECLNYNLSGRQKYFYVMAASDVSYHHALPKNTFNCRLY